MATPSLSTELQQAAQMQAHLPGTSVVLIGLVALVAVAARSIWSVTQHATTIAHEGAHAVVGSAAGRKVTYIKIKMNADGKTGLAPAEGAGFILAGIVGYLGPSGFGLIAAKLIQVGHIVAVLWLAIFALACMLVMVRKSFGLVSVIGCGLAIYIVARYMSLGAQVAAAYGIAWFLLLAGVADVRRHWTDAGDAGILRGLTRLPPGFWARLWLVGSVAALVLGATLLL
jgi:hypothetical protein